MMDYPPQHAADPPRTSRRGTFVFATVLSVVMVLAFCVDFVLNWQRFPTKNIDVVGDLGHPESDQLAATVARVSTGNILRVDITKVVEAAQSLSWVENATIRRKWPDTIEVQVNLRKVRARFNDDEYLDQFGIPFKSPTPIDRSLPRLSGPRNSAAEILTAYEAWNEASSRVGLAVKSIWLSERGSWELFVSPIRRPDERYRSDYSSEPIKVILGSGDINDRSKRFLKLYAELFQPLHEKISVIDLRYPDGVSVTWKGDVPIMHGSQSIANT